MTKNTHVILELDEQEASILLGIIQTLLANPTPRFIPEAVRLLEYIDAHLPRNR